LYQAVASNKNAKGEKKYKKEWDGDDKKGRIFHIRQKKSLTKEKSIKVRSKIKKARHGLRI